jgi:hypothetical protein
MKVLYSDHIFIDEISSGFVISFAQRDTVENYFKHDHFIVVSRIQFNKDQMKYFYKILKGKLEEIKLEAEGG